MSDSDAKQRLHLNSMDTKSVSAYTASDCDMSLHRNPSCFHRMLDSKVLPAIIVAFFVLVVLPGCVFGAIHLFSKLVFADFKPRENTLIGQSHDCVKMWGRQTINQNPLSIVVQSNPRGTSLIEGQNAVAMWSLTRQLEELQNNFRQLALNVSSYFMPVYMNTSYVGGVNNDSLLFSVFWETMAAKPYVADIQAFLDKTLYAQLGEVTMTVTGVPPLESAMQDTVLSNMGTIDAICIPTGLCIFAMAVRTSPFTMVVPLLTLIISLTGPVCPTAPNADHHGLCARDDDGRCHRLVHGLLAVSTVTHS